MCSPLFESAFKLLDKGWSIERTRVYLLKTAEEFGESAEDVERALKHAKQCLHADPPSALPSVAESQNTAGG